MWKTRLLADADLAKNTTVSGVQGQSPGGGQGDEAAWSSHVFVYLSTSDHSKFNLKRLFWAIKKQLKWIFADFPKNE